MNTKGYIIWGLVLLSTAYTAWVGTTYGTGWFFWLTLFVLNPVCVFFLVMMYIKRDEVRMIYTSMLWYWRQRSEYKKLKKELEAQKQD